MKIKTRINVPKEYEEAATLFGAMYDGRMKSFYVPSDTIISIFTPFIPLSVELVPSSNWSNNVRSVYKDEWDAIRRESYRLANHKCEICGENGDTSKGENFVECHEIWSYSQETKIQKLEGLITLCPKCHKTKHWGLASMKGEEHIVRKHIAKINGWKDQDIDKYIDEVFTLFDIRSQIEWELDLSVLEGRK